MIPISHRNGEVSEKAGSGCPGDEFLGLVKGWLGAGGTLWEKNRARRARLGQTDVYLQPPEGYKTNSGKGEDGPWQYSPDSGSDSSRQGGRRAAERSSGSDGLVRNQVGSQDRRESSIRPAFPADLPHPAQTPFVHLGVKIGQLSGLASLPDDPNVGGAVTCLTYICECFSIRARREPHITRNSGASAGSSVTTKATHSPSGEI